MSYSPLELAGKHQSVETCWANYQKRPEFEGFVEFVISLNSLTEFLQDKGLAGLSHAGQALEQLALSLFGDDSNHPLPAEAQIEVSGQMARLSQAMQQHLADVKLRQERRAVHGEAEPVADAPGFRSIWLLSKQADRWQDMLAQLGYFGMKASSHHYHDLPPVMDDMPMLLLDATGCELDEWQQRLATLRAQLPACRIIGLSMRAEFNLLQSSLAGGCDFCLLEDTPVDQIVARLLELGEPVDLEPFRILIVEDSLTATKLVQRALDERQITTQAIQDPKMVLHALHQFNPELILMDMHMPGCTGVEATRIIRQDNHYLSIPIVYLSGETDVALQVEALRLGGDLFLTKPFNPVFLNAIVKSKVERYRALRRSMYHDSLTGLLNHTSTKTSLEASLSSMLAQGQPMTIAMIDIDHFKRVNDTYGHPMGDQVIRSLAWLLRQRLRKTDIVGRYGGEEFVVGLPGVDADQALVILDRIRTDFACIRHPFRDQHFSVSFSAGAADHTIAGDAEDLINAADEALYHAKREGRNRIHLARRTPFAA